MKLKFPNCNATLQGAHIGGKQNKWRASQEKVKSKKKGADFLLGCTLKLKFETDFQ